MFTDLEDPEKMGPYATSQNPVQENKDMLYS